MLSSLERTSSEVELDGIGCEAISSSSAKETAKEKMLLLGVSCSCEETK